MNDYTDDFDARADAARMRLVLLLMVVAMFAVFGFGVAAMEFAQWISAL
jgi:hypothetical protein